MPGPKEIVLSDTNTATRTQVNDAVKRILKNRDQIVKSIRNIIDDLLFLKNNQEIFLKHRGITLEDFIKLELGFSKASFYQHIKAYQVCIDLGNPELYVQVSNYKSLLEVARIDDKKTQKKVFKMIEKNPDTTPDNVQEITGSWKEANKSDEEIEQKAVVKLKQAYEQAKKLELDINEIIEPSQKTTGFMTRNTIVDNAIELLNDYKKRKKNIKHGLKDTQLNNLEMMEAGVADLLKKCIKGGLVSEHEQKILDKKYNIRIEEWE